MRRALPCLGALVAAATAGCFPPNNPVAITSPPPLYKSPTERDLREGGPHALCLQLAIGACRDLECPRCSNRVRPAGHCGVATAAAVAALIAGNAKSASTNPEVLPNQLDCGTAEGVDTCRKQCRLCAEASERCESPR